LASLSEVEIIQRNGAAILMAPSSNNIKRIERWAALLKGDRLLNSVTARRYFLLAAVPEASLSFFISSRIKESI